MTAQHEAPHTPGGEVVVEIEADGLADFAITVTPAEESSAEADSGQPEPPPTVIMSTGEVERLTRMAAGLELSARLEAELAQELAGDAQFAMIHRTHALDLKAEADALRKLLAGAQVVAPAEAAAEPVGWAAIAHPETRMGKIVGSDRYDVETRANHLYERGRYDLFALYPAPAEARSEKAVQDCERCAGNGEIVTDWPTYLHPPERAPADAGTADCPDCGGSGQARSVEPATYAEKVTAYNAIFDPADEAGRETFAAGFREGWMYANYPEGPDSYEDGAEEYNGAVDGVTLGEAWDAHRDTFFARLPIAALPPRPTPPKA